MTDLVNHPPHYKAGAIETIDVIESFGLGFHLGNVVKYVLRSAYKGSTLADLQKARWYLDREIAQIPKREEQFLKVVAWSNAIADRSNRNLRRREQRAAKKTAGKRK